MRCLQLLSFPPAAVASTDFVSSLIHPFEGWITGKTAGPTADHASVHEDVEIVTDTTQSVNAIGALRSGNESVESDGE